MTFFRRIFSLVFNLWTRLFDTDEKFKHPEKFGSGPHDCALVALHIVAPRVSEDEIKDAFLFSTENWPHGGVTNKEFNITLNYLKLKFEYDDSEGQTIGSLIQRKDPRCVALIHGHYIALRRGKIVGEHLSFNPKIKVYCNWIF